MPFDDLQDIGILNLNDPEEGEDSVGNAFLSLPESKGLDEETEDPLKASVQGPAEDHLPKEVIYNQPEVVEGLQRWQDNPVPTDILSPVVEDAKAVAGTFAKMAYRDSQQQWWENQKSLLVLQKTGQLAVSDDSILSNIDEGAALERIVIEAVAVHSGLFPNYGIQEPFIPEDLRQLNEEQFDRLSDISVKVSKEMIEYMDQNPDKPGYEALRYAMERVQKDTGELLGADSSFAWGKPSDTDIVVTEGEDPQGIQSSLKSMLDAREWIKQRKKNEFELAQRKLTKIDAMSYELLMENMEPMLNDERMPDTDDPIALLEYDVEKAMYMGGFVSKILSMVPAVLTPEGLMTQDASQLGMFLVEAERLGIIKDSADLAGSIDTLTKLRDDLLGNEEKRGLIADAQLKYEQMTDPEYQYQQSVLYFFNKRFGNRFEQYSDVAAHVKEMIFNGDNYPNGYVVNVLSTFTDTHKVFSQLLEGEQERTALNVLQDRINSNRNKANQGGPDAMGSRNIEHTVFSYWDPSSSQRGDTSGRVAEDAGRYYSELINSIAKRWEDLAGEELTEAAMASITNSIVLEDGIWVRSDISTMDPVLISAYTSTMMNEFINNPTTKIPRPIEDLSKYIREGIGLLNDHDLFDPKNIEGQLKAHNSLTTLNILFDKAVDSTSSNRIREALGLNHSEYRNLKLFKEYLQFSGEEYWSNPGQWFATAGGDEDTLILNMSRGRDIMSALGIAMATVFEGIDPAMHSQLSSAKKLFGGSDDNILNKIPFHSEDSLVIYMTDTIGNTGLTGWDMINKAFENANIVMPKDENKAREWLQEMLKDPDGKTRQFFPVSKEGEDLQQILIDDYPQYGLALMIGLVSKGIESRSRLSTFVNALEISGTGHKPTIVNLFQMADYFSQYGDGVIIGTATEEGELFYSTEDFDTGTQSIATTEKRPDETMGQAAGRLWANPPTQDKQTYVSYVGSQHTLDMLGNTFLINPEERSKGSDYWSTFITKLGLTGPDGTKEWNSVVSSAITDITQEYQAYFSDADRYNQYIKKYGKDGLPGNLDLTLEVVRRVFEKYPQVSNKITGDEGLTSLLGLHKHTLATQPITSDGLTVYKYPASVVAHPPTNRELSTFRDTASTQVDIIITQAFGDELIIPFPISMHEDHFYYNRKTYKGLGADVIPVEAGMLGGYISTRQQEESLRYLKLIEERTGRPATLRSGTTIIGGTVVEN